MTKRGERKAKKARKNAILSEWTKRPRVLKESDAERMERFKEMVESKLPYECHPLQPVTTWHRTMWLDEDE